MSIDTELFTFPMLPVFLPTCSFFHTPSFHEWSLPTRLFVSQPSPCSYNFGSQNSRIFLNAGGSPLPPALSHAVSSVQFSSSSLFFDSFFGYLTCSKALQGSPQIALPFPSLRCFTLSSCSDLPVLTHHAAKNCVCFSCSKPCSLLLFQSTSCRQEACSVFPLGLPGRGHAMPLTQVLSKN